MVDNILDREMSYYSNVRDINGKTITVRKALELNKNGEFKRHADKLRATEDKKERQAYKIKNNPGSTFQGKFKQRAIEKLEQATGILSADIDIEGNENRKEKAEAIKAEVIKLPYVLSAFLSPSYGVKILIRIPIVKDDIEYKKYYATAEQKLNAFNIKADKATKDISRLCFGSYDPDIYINENAEEMELEDIKEEITKEKTETNRNDAIPNSCPVIEKYLCKSEFPSTDGYSRHAYTDGNVYQYCLDKPELLEAYKKAQGREDSAFNDCDGWVFSCASIKKYLKKNAKDNPIVKNALNACWGCDNKPSYIQAEDPETEISILKQHQDIDFDYTIKILENCTEHLPLYKSMENYLNLQGDNYNSFKKWLYYRFNSLAQPSIRTEVARNVAADNHIHGLMIAPPASGKGLIKNSEKNFCKHIGNDICYEITALSHREQLIGKNVKTKEGRKSIPGILSAKSVLHDECQSIINEEKEQHSETMRVIRQAMDVYGDNEISKKLIEDTFDDTLKYYSPTRFISFMHPTNFQPVFFQTGSFRRYSMIFEGIGDRNISLNNMTKIKLEAEETDKTFIDCMIELYSNIKEKRPITELNYTQECLDIISDFHALLLEFCIKHGNSTLLRYALNTTYSLRVHFMRFVNISHLSKGLKVTHQKRTILACCDMFQSFLVTLKTLNKYGNLTINNDVWFGLETEEILTLEYLLRKKAISQKESSVSIKRFDTVLAELFGLQTRQTRAKRHKLKQSGFIDFKQIGMNDSKVWLLKVPSEIKIIEDDYIPNAIINYFKGGNDENHPLPPLNRQIWENEELYLKNLLPLFKGGKDGSNSGVCYKNVYTRKITYLLTLFYYLTDIPKTLPPLPPYKTTIKFKEDTPSTSTIQPSKGGNHPETPLPPLKPKKVKKKVSKIYKTKLNLYEAVKECDEGQGADMKECQEFMGCSDTDFEQYVDYGKATGDVWECRAGYLKIMGSDK